MRVRVIAVGKLRDPSVATLCGALLVRLRPYHRVEVIEVRAADGSHAARAIDEESAAIARAIDPADHVWLLDRGGEAMSSEALSLRLERLALEGTSQIVFVIGGTYGVGAALAARANLRWSLSGLTFLHEWARAIVLEQLYRAAKIARDEPYHH